MAKYKVTGGATGTLGIDVGNRRYEAGDTVDMTAAAAGWLVERGLLQSTGKAKPDPESEPDPDPDFIEEGI